MKPDPEIIQATLLYARQAMQHGDRQDACWWVEQAVTLDPDSKEAWLFLAALVRPRTRAKYYEWMLKVNLHNEQARKGIYRALETMRREQAAQPSNQQPAPCPTPEENTGSGRNSGPLPGRIAADPAAQAALEPFRLHTGSWLARWQKALADIPRSDIWISLAYLAAVTVAESMTVLSSIPQLGLALHGLLLTVIILHAGLFSHGARQKLLMTLSLGPLIRLMSLTLPLQGFPLIYWYALIGAPLFLAAFLVYRFVRTGPANLRLNARSFPLQILVGISGLGLGYLEYRILHPAPLISSLSWEHVWLPALILFFFTGMLEEVIFRGLIQRNATASLGRYGMLYSALWFAVLHLGYRSFLDVLFVFVVAIFFGWVVSRTGSLFGVTMSHGLTNISLYLVIPFLIQTPSPTITAPWVNIIPTKQRIMIVTPTITATPTFSNPTVPTSTHPLTPTASATATKYISAASITPTSTFQPVENVPARTPVATKTLPLPTAVSTTPAPQNTRVPPTPIPQDTPVLPTPVPQDTPVP
jgi:uncharacterized protein